MYKLLFSIFFRHVPAETAHRLGFGLIRAVATVPGLGWLLRRWLVPRDPVLRVRALGLDLPGPLGLAAGFDKDALGSDALGVLGFAFIEIGTVTAQPQPGNPTPRLFRLVADRALVNRTGFNNAGSAAAAERLRARRRGRGVVVGVNIGKTKTVPENKAVIDYVASAKLLADLALELELDGIIATNTTIYRDGLATDTAQVEAIGAGGLSGAPLKDRSLAVLRRLHSRVGDRLVLVGVGGIETAEDAWTRIKAGATLVQAYTGFVYGGPLWPRHIHRGLAHRARQAGYASISQATGSPPPEGNKDR